MIHSPKELERLRQRRSNAPVQFVALLFFVVLAFATWAAQNSLGTSNLALHLAIAFAGLSCIYVFAMAYAVERNALDPLCIAMLYIFLLFPFHGYFAIDTDSVVVRLGYDRHEYFVYGLLIAGMASHLLLFGYQSRFPARMAARIRQPKSVIDDNHPALNSKLAMIYGVATLGRLVMVADGQNYHYRGHLEGANTLVQLQFILLTLDSLATFIAMYLLALGLRYKNNRRMQFGLALILVELAWGILSGSRFKMVLPLFMVALVFSEVRKTVRLSTLIVAVALFTFVVFPLATGFRGAYMSQMSEIARDGVSADILTSSVSDALEDTTPDGFISQKVDAVDLLAERMHGLTSLALVMRYTPERHDYLYGIPFVAIPVHIFVPRLLWPDKPTASKFMLTFRTTYWGNDRADKTSIMITMLGDLWVNLHLVGVIFGMFIFGIALGYLKRHIQLGGGTNSVFPVVVYAVLFVPVITSLGSSVDGVVAGLTKTMFVYWLAGRFLATPRAKSRQLQTGRRSHPKPQVV